MWKTVKLGDMCEIITGNSIPVKEKKIFILTLRMVHLMSQQKI